MATKAADSKTTKAETAVETLYPCWTDSRNTIFGLDRQSKYCIRVGHSRNTVFVLCWTHRQSKLYPCWIASRNTVLVLDRQSKHRIRVGQSKQCIRDGQTGKTLCPCWTDSQNCIRVGQTVETVSVSVGQPKLYPVETVSVLGRLSKLYPFLETMKTCWTDSRNCIHVGQTVEIPYTYGIGCRNCIYT